MRHLEDLRDKHEEEEIWILGRGPSLDDYPNNFFDDKTSIAVTWAFLAFPNSTYYSSFHAEEGEWVERNWPDKFNKCILCCLIGSSQGDMQRRSVYEHSGEIPIYAKVRFGKGLGVGRFKASVERLIAKESCDLIDSITSLHTAIQIAIVLGARKITLAGCELKMRNGHIHAKRTWPSANQEAAVERRHKGSPTEKFFLGSKWGLEWLAKICKPHGIDIARYYYEKGYEQIEIP